MLIVSKDHLSKKERHDERLRLAKEKRRLAKFKHVLHRARILGYRVSSIDVQADGCHMNEQHTMIISDVKQIDGGGYIASAEGCNHCWVGKDFKFPKGIQELNYIVAKNKKGYSRLVVQDGCGARMTCEKNYFVVVGKPPKELPFLLQVGKPSAPKANRRNRPIIEGLQARPVFAEAADAVAQEIPRRPLPEELPGNLNRPVVVQNLVGVRPDNIIAQAPPIPLRREGRGR